MALQLSGTKALFVLAALGLAAGIFGAYYFNQRPQPQKPVFQPAENPYAKGIYANGMIESDQPSGSNLSVYPEVTATVAEVLVKPGQVVKAGQPLLRLDDSVPRASAGQQQAQALAAQALLDELKAEPRAETLHVAEAQLAAAEASAKQARDSYDKQQHAFDIDPHAVSRDALDSAHNAWRVAESNRVTAQKQLELTRAGAWSYDIRNQAAQQQALQKAYEASQALLAKYTLRAAADGSVLAVNAAPGMLVTPQGAYDAYTQASNDPLLVLGGPPGHLQVRCYVDEILIPHLPDGAHIKARMTIRGTTTNVALEFVRIEPYVTPKISLSDQRQERVDVRVLPVIFRFAPAPGLKAYAGELVDVYIGE